MESIVGTGIEQGTDIVVYFEEGKETTRMIGQYVSETDDWLTVEGTVGRYIGHEIRIPKFRIVMIEA